MFKKEPFVYLNFLQTVKTSDEMLHNETFHQALHILPRQNRSSEKFNFLGEISTCDPLKYKLWTAYQSVWKIPLGVN